MKNGLTIALAISLVLGAAALWGSCAVPDRLAGEGAGFFPGHPVAYTYAAPGENIWHSTP